MPYAKKSPSIRHQINEDMRIAKLLFLLVGIAFLAGCDESNDKDKKVKGKASSAPYELLVVANKEWLKGPYGTEFMEVMHSEVPGLPQVEPNFRTTSVNPHDFTSTFKVYSNIVTVDIDSKHTEASMKMARDVYAHPQIILTISAPSNEALVSYCQEHRYEIMDLFVEQELQRDRDFLRKSNSGKVATAVHQMFGYEVCVPKEINAIKRGDRFLWASSDTETSNNYNFVIYTLPYTSTQDLQMEKLIERRDSVMKTYLEGEKDGQYIQTTPRTALERDIAVGGEYVKEIRGLWRMYGGTMGGPFVEYARIDTTKNVIVVTEGFVYAPEKKKRDLIRRMEASLRTLKM